jgi:hypothetical protein
VTRWLKKAGDYVDADRESTPRNLPAGRGQAAEGSNDVGHGAVEQLEGRCRRFRLGVPQPRRSLDVGEKQRHHSRWQRQTLTHVAPVRQ